MLPAHPAGSHESSQRFACLRNIWRRLLHPGRADRMHYVHTAKNRDDRTWRFAVRDRSR
jgi:hypothetical protein